MATIGDDSGSASGTVAIDAYFVKRSDAGDVVAVNPATLGASLHAMHGGGGFLHPLITCGESVWLSHCVGVSGPTTAWPVQLVVPSAP